MRSSKGPASADTLRRARRVAWLAAALTALVSCNDRDDDDFQTAPAERVRRFTPTQPTDGSVAGGASARAGAVAEPTRDLHMAPRTVAQGPSSGAEAPGS